ncbi:hypothetical protein ACTPEM_24330, partial [Clostridioides difficile]
EVQMMYYVDIAYEKSKNLNVLINDLFELTKMQNNTIKLNKIELDESTIFIEGYDFSKTTFKSVQAITIFSIDSFLTSSISLFQIS